MITRSEHAAGTPRVLCRCRLRLDTSKWGRRVRSGDGAARTGGFLSDSDRARGYDRQVSVEDPLVNALEEIAPKLTAELERVMAALRAGEPVEDAWETMLQEILDEA